MSARACELRGGESIPLQSELARSPGRYVVLILRRNIQQRAKVFSLYRKYRRGTRRNGVTVPKIPLRTAKIRGKCHGGWRNVCMRNDTPGFRVTFVNFAMISRRPACIFARLSRMPVSGSPRSQRRSRMFRSAPRSRPLCSALRDATIIMSYSCTRNVAPANRRWWIPGLQRGTRYKLVACNVARDIDSTASLSRKLRTLASARERESRWSERLIRLSRLASNLASNIDTSTLDDDDESGSASGARKRRGKNFPRGRTDPPSMTRGEGGCGRGEEEGRCPAGPSSSAKHGVTVTHAARLAESHLDNKMQSRGDKTRVVCSRGRTWDPSPVSRAAPPPIPLARVRVTVMEGGKKKSRVCRASGNLSPEATRNS